MKASQRKDSELLQVLVVEDNDADVTLLREAFEMVDADVDLSIAADGETAIDILTGNAERDDVSLPDLIILDLGLPGMSGQEVLVSVKTDPRLQRIPVLVLTDTDAPRTVNSVYEKHANAYVNKGEELDHLIDFAESVDQFWGRVATLPASAGER